MGGGKTLVLLRHAHRDVEERSRDNGLSEKGEEQVRRMVEFARKRLEDSAPVFLSSPKKRCVETLSPLARALGGRVVIDPRLSERSPVEGAAEYLARLEEFLDFWKYECPETTIVCSHGDWIPDAIHRLTGAESALKKCGWAEIEYLNGSGYLTWLVQKHY